MASRLAVGLTALPRLTRLQLALLTNQTRTTDVIAGTNLMLLALARDDFDEVTVNHPGSRAGIEKAAQARLAELHQRRPPPAPGASDAATSNRGPNGEVRTRSLGRRMSLSKHMGGVVNRSNAVVAPKASTHSNEPLRIDPCSPCTSPGSSSRGKNLCAAANSSQKPARCSISMDGCDGLKRVRRASFSGANCPEQGVLHACLQRSNTASSFSEITAIKPDAEQGGISEQLARLEARLTKTTDQLDELAVRASTDKYEHLARDVAQLTALLVDMSAKVDKLVESNKG